METPVAQKPDRLELVFVATIGAPHRDELQLEGYASPPDETVMSMS